MSKTNVDKSKVTEALEPQKYLEHLWHYFDGGLAYIDSDGYFLKVNPNFCELVGYTESELLHRRNQDISHPDDVYDDLEMKQKLYNGNLDYYIMNKRYITKNNNIIWIKIKVTKILDNQGNVQHLVKQLARAIIVSDSQEYEPKKIYAQYNWLYTAIPWIGSVLLLIAGAIWHYATINQIVKDHDNKIQHLEEVLNNK
jgi:PAS domain S-box-containing protein